MILLGIAIYPSLHPALLYSPVVVSAGTTSLALTDAQNPASSIRTFALLLALMRGGLSVKMSFFSGGLGVATVLLATVPYALELIVMALLAPVFLPGYYGESAAFGTPPALASFESSAVWAALSPSIVIPNMLTFVEQGLTEAGRVVLTGAPLEVSTALVTEGVMDGVLQAQVGGTNSAVVLWHIFTYVLGSALYGIAFALSFYGFRRFREMPWSVAQFGKIDPSEVILQFVVTFVLCYTTSQDSVNTPWLIGFFAALSMAICTQYLMPAVADEMCLALKPAWYFAEAFLFVLTGCVIRPAIDSGLSTPLFGNFLALLVVGSCARCVGDALVTLVWQWHILNTPPWHWTRAQWKDAALRTAFLLMATTPKATLQGTLGPKVAKTFAAAAKSLDPTYASPAAFVAPAAAVAILYCASIGTVLTFLVGKGIARHFQDQAEEGKSAAPTQASRSEDATTATVLLEEEARAPSAGQI